MNTRTKGKAVTGLVILIILCIAAGAFLLWRHRIVTPPIDLRHIGSAKQSLLSHSPQSVNIRNAAKYRHSRSAAVLQNTPRQNDFFSILLNTYDTVFLSTYPIKSFSEADYQYFRAMTVLKTDYLLPDFSSLEYYMKNIARSGNTVSTVYLGIRPDKITAEEIAVLAAAWPELAFEVILACPSVEYWRGLSDSEYERILTAYCDFLADADTIAGTHTYFFSAEEWLISNPLLYTDKWSLTADAAKFVMTHSDSFHDYQVTTENAALLSSALRRLTAVQRTEPTVYPDLSNTAIVFFGDSVIGNYLDGMSIPGFVQGFTNATVYNCGYGGNPAAMNDKTIITLPGIAAAFVAQDLSVLPKDAQVYAGISQYIASPPQTEKLCFVISYGLNDYFNGQPLYSEDPDDITTYYGAIRTAVCCLKENYADAQIFLCTPTYTAQTGGSKDLSQEDYVNCVIKLAHELDVAVIDNYRFLGIDETNYKTYLVDMVHPNEEARFMFAQKIIDAVCK
ncbi:MAG: SGNH/GDSL hydrolase family protein [Firmicutes bacterium]|nr:SGNH/GDSL hydrolase family protein [Bacillota bacterium]